MPIMDGPKTAIEIKKVYEDFRKDLRSKDPDFKGEALVVPEICCLSAYTGKQYVERAKKAGMNHYLGKPADVSELIKLLISCGVHI